MRFLADMGVNVQIVQWLRQNGEDAVHLRDEGLQRLPDALSHEAPENSGSAKD
jgi:predicted nuclease of predicted toxin-antitoxin system